MPYVLVITFLLASCYQQPPPSSAKKSSSSARVHDDDDRSSTRGDRYDSEDDDLDDDDADTTSYHRRPQVSRFALDDTRFLVTSVALGLKDFISTKSPILTYTIPRDADYVEVMRCLSSANVATSIDNVTIGDIALGADTRSFRTADFFRAAEETDGCEMISLGEISGVFQDTYAPTGTFAYLIRACVAEERLTDRDQLTKRVCTKQIAISEEITYKNKRLEQELQALRKVAVYEAKVDQTFWSVRLLAEDLIQEAQRCEDREVDRLIDVKIKEAWVTVVATAADVALELASYGKTNPGKVAQHYLLPTSFGRAMDTMGMIGAMGGLSFREMIINLTTGSEDMPRSCARLQSLQLKMQGYMSTLNHDFYGVAYYANAAQIAASGADIADGESLPPPSSGFDGGGF